MTEFCADFYIGTNLFIILNSFIIYFYDSGQLLALLKLLWDKKNYAMVKVCVYSIWKVWNKAIQECYRRDSSTRHCYNTYYKLNSSRKLSYDLKYR